MVNEVAGPQRLAGGSARPAAFREAPGCGGRPVPASGCPGASTALAAPFHPAALTRTDGRAWCPGD